MPSRQRQGISRVIGVATDMEERWEQQNLGDLDERMNFACSTQQ